jgi:UDPglucose 6-dehydrogenase
VSTPSVSSQPAIAVAGLWHLGAVIAACLADAGYDVTAVDPDPEVVAGLREDRPAVDEPGLAELLGRSRRAGHLRFVAPGEAIGAAQLVWIAFDTPVDEDDRADVAWVLDEASRLLASAASGALVVVSSQLPVGSIAALRDRMAGAGRDDLCFACVPENLRLGTAIETFRAPDRFVAGVWSDAEADRLAPVLSRFSERTEWMSVESAEMTKHALNAFLATSVAFINELAGICEGVGAEAADVARGLRSDRRIGPGAYLSPGDAFAGGTLARDVHFLGELALRDGLPAQIVSGVADSNTAHRGWARRHIAGLLSGGDESAPLTGRTVALWGLTYKPGTDTLRRSSAIELCQWLASAGATVRAHDPAVHRLPPELADAVALVEDPVAAAGGADALVVGTAWPVFRSVAADAVADAMASPLVLDAGGHLRETLGQAERIRYLRVGAAIR